MNNVTTFDNFPPFATNGSRKMNTESAKYAVGFLEGETFPAEWANYLFHGATKGVSDLNTAVQSIWKENINVIQGSGQTPNPSDNTQLKTAIELMIQNAVLTANSQVLAQAKLDAHPVGSLYWSSKPTDPSELFGGTWVRIKDRFIFAKGDSDKVNATGGSKTVKLTESNLPAHTHSCSTVDTNHTHNVGSSMRSNLPNGMSGFKEGPTWSKQGKFSPVSATTSGSNGQNSSIRHSHTISGGGNGTASGDAHENMPPYIVKYCWERTA